MSFPRAKIQRFNDVLNNVPSPTKYDPKLGDKVKGGCILKGEVKGSTVSDNASASSGKSCQTPYNFRTPQVPKKHNCLGILERGSQSAFKSISFKSEDVDFLNNDGESEELKALRVECSNKTETINDLEKHINDLKTQLSIQEKSKAALDGYIAELEVAKSNLECIKSNNENYEQQINTIQSVKKTLEEKINVLLKSKEELSGKLEEIEKKNSNLEESNLDYERKLINLEGTIEQLHLEVNEKQQLIAELKQKEEVYKMNHKVSVECLQGKISTLENEIKEMDVNKSKNEATIFGLETQISNLNCSIENLKTEKIEVESVASVLKSKLEDLEQVCKNQRQTITELEIELGGKLREMEQIKEANDALKVERDMIKTEMNKEKLMFIEKQNELMLAHKEKLSILERNFGDMESQLDKKKQEFDVEKLALTSSHEEEILKLQNEYETKLLTQMQENTEKVNALQCQLDDKDASLKKAKSEHLKSMAEWENKLEEVEKKFSDLVTKLEAQHLEKVDGVKESYTKKIKTAESNFSRMIDRKNKEIDILSDQYKEILEETKCLLSYLEKKDEEIKELIVSKKSLNSRMKMMLEEIKLLNQENEAKTKNLIEMTKKYNDEFSKNEQLSCKLGELDTKLYHLREDLNKKVEEWKRSSEELKKSKYMYDKLVTKKCDLEQKVSELQRKVESLVKELDKERTVYEENVSKLNDELIAVKSKCKKFEIASENTSEALEALRNRLIECECDFENLLKENSSLTEELKKNKKEKDDLELKIEKLVETKLDLETTLDEELARGRQLTEKCDGLDLLCKDYRYEVDRLSKLNGTLEHEKQNHLETIRNLVQQQELQLIETEKATLDQIEQLSHTMTEKLEFFLKFSSEKVRKLSGKIKNLKATNEEMNQCLKSKSDEYDNLFTDYEILKTTVDISVKESENLKNKYEEQILKMDEMKNSIEKLVNEKKGLESTLTEMENSYSELKEKYENAQKQLVDKVEVLEKVEETNISMREEILKLRSEAKDQEEIFRIKLEEVELKMEDLNREIREKDGEIATCQEEKMIYMQELKALSDEKNDLMFNLKIADGKLTANEKLVREIRESKATIEEKNCQLKMELNAAISERCSLESELLCVKNELTQLRQDKLNLESFAERKNYYKDNCLRLDKLNQELKEENLSLKNDFNEIHSVLKEKETELEKLIKKCGDLESLIGPFREQLELYETQRLMIENDREQLRKQHLEQAAQLGHTNHKQKIQHVVNLKNTLLETKKENEKLTLEIKNLKRKIQKLQEQLGYDPKRLFIGGKRPSATPFKGKENNGLMTPTAAVSSTTQIKQEPMSPGSPLRNRNQ